jgi:DNA-binding response OmpR family regulator
LKLRESGDLEEMSVIVLSTSSQPEDRAQALSLGATRYITKPFKFEDWVQELESICLEIPAQTAETLSTIRTI